MNADAPTRLQHYEDNLPMVSHVEVTDRSRRAGSVSSWTRSSHRHHSRHNRSGSQHGGTSSLSQNEFPFFAQTGDVEISINCNGQEKRYLLHRLILAQFSGFFETGMSDEWSRNPTAVHNSVNSTSRPEQALTVIGEEAQSPPALTQPGLVTADQITYNAPNRKRWRYELDWQHVEEDEEPILVQKQIPPGSVFTPNVIATSSAMTRPRPAHSHSTSFFRSVANLTLSGSHYQSGSQSTAQLAAAAPVDPCMTNPLIRDYDNLFRIFYNFAPNLNSTNIATAYSECKALIGLADMYDALTVVGPRLDHHLLRFSSRLFKQIAKYPPSYLKLGYLARSRIIFSEALTHVVGQWPAPLPYLKPPDHTGGGYEVPQSVLDLIEDKYDELEELRQKIESKLFRLTLTTSRGERVNPSNDYLGWLAMSLWRQWVAENTTPEVRGILKNSAQVTNSPALRPGTGHSNHSLPVHGRPSINTNHAPPPPPVFNPARIYRLIASTDSQTYLPDDELKRFLKIHLPATSQHSSGSTSLYTRENFRRFQRKVDEIKNVARDIVKPLTRNCLELDLRSLSDGLGGGLGYLTCTKVDDCELPWD